MIGQGRVVRANAYRTFRVCESICIMQEEANHKEEHLGGSPNNIGVMVTMVIVNQELNS